jgi:hypothetical protein
MLNDEHEFAPGVGRMGMDLPAPQQVASGDLDTKCPGIKGNSYAPK